MTFLGSSREETRADPSAARTSVGPTSVALYLRVSSEDQDLAGQERELRAYADSRRWVVTRVFAEKNTATGRVERAAWEELRERASHPDFREFDRVLVWALDRWSRDPSFVRAIGSIEELEAHGLRFHSFREPALDSSEDGRPSFEREVLRALLPVVASFEVRRRAERTRVAMQELKSGRRKTASGRPVGRPRRVTPEIEAAIRQKRYVERLPWAKVALAVHLPAGTCRKVRPASPPETPRVEKGQDGFGTQEGSHPSIPSLT